MYRGDINRGGIHEKLVLLEREFSLSLLFKHWFSF